MKNRIHSVVSIQGKHGTQAAIRPTCAHCDMSFQSHHRGSNALFTSLPTSLIEHTVMLLENHDSVFVVWPHFDVSQTNWNWNKFETTDGATKCYIMQQYCVIPCFSAPRWVVGSDGAKKPWGRTNFCLCKCVLYLHKCYLIWYTLMIWLCIVIPILLAMVRDITEKAN